MATIEETSDGSVTIKETESAVVRFSGDFRRRNAAYRNAIFGYNRIIG